MIDIESRVAESLRARADRAVPASGGLRAGAVARARTIRRRRVAAGSAGVLVAVATAGVLAVPSLLAGEVGQSGSPGAAGPAPMQAVTTSGPTTLPELAEVPGAAEQPGSVGTDPAVLHFDAYLEQLGAEESQWRSGPGYEGVTGSAASGQPRWDLYIGSDADTLDRNRPWPGHVLLYADGDTMPLYDEGEPRQTTVDDRPATIQKVTQSDLDELGPPDTLPPATRIASLEGFGAKGPTWVLRWQPVDGLHAIVQVRGDDRELAFEVAGALRLDRAQRCAMPLRLAAIPAGAEWTGCRTALAHGPAGGVTWVRSGIELTGPGDDEVLVYAEDAARADHPGDADVVPNRTVAGHPAWWSTEAPAGLYVPELGPAAVFVEGADEATATQLIEDLTVASDLTQPDSWPRM